MLTYDVERAKQAVQYLVGSPYYKHHVRRLRNSLGKAVVQPFHGETEPLNELVVIGRQSAQALENLFKVVEGKRSAQGSYMRQFMATKRQRERKVVQVEEARQRRKLSLDERIEFLRTTYERWAKEKDEHVARCALQYEVQFGRSPAWAHKNEFIRDFWVHKDIQLDVELGRATDAPAERRLRHRRGSDGVVLGVGRRSSDKEQHC